MSVQHTNPGAFPADSALQVYLLGTVDFETALALQKRLHFEITGNRSQAAVILCEHPPLITVGRQGSLSHIFLEPRELAQRGWRVRWVNRGGGCLLHLPGQLVVYPILPLDQLRLSVVDYLRVLGLVLEDLLKEFHLSRPITATPEGIWVGQRMLGALGVAIHDWVSYYGAYVNIHPSLDLFRRIDCDHISREPMTSLERERRGPVRPSLIRERLIEHLKNRLGFGRVSLFSDHPALQGHMQRCAPFSLVR